MSPGPKSQKQSPKQTKAAARSKQSFPENLIPDEQGIVAIGGEIDAALLVDAYSKGIFPWPQDGLPVLWFSPHRRGVMRSSEIHVSKSLRKSIRKLECEWTWNTAFADVIRACQRVPRPGQDGTWITEELLAGYVELFESGRAYSLECWMASDGASKELVAGIYGVWMGKFVSGESMFSFVEDGSKVALCLLAQILRSQGVEFLDTQMVSGVVGAMGGVEMARAQFLDWVVASFRADQRVPSPDPTQIWKSLIAEL